MQQGANRQISGRRPPNRRNSVCMGKAKPTNSPSNFASGATQHIGSPPISPSHGPYGHGDRTYIRMGGQLTAVKLKGPQSTPPTATAADRDRRLGHRDSDKMATRGPLRSIGGAADARLSRLHSTFVIPHRDPYTPQAQRRPHQSLRSSFSGFRRAPTSPTRLKLSYKLRHRITEAADCATNVTQRGALLIPPSPSMCSPNPDDPS